MVLEGENLVTSAKSTGLGLSELATVFDNLQPDAVVTIADRYETLATAVAASYMNIPVAHVQGGEVTGSIDEKVRHAVTKLSNLHLVSTEARARARDAARRGPSHGVRHRLPVDRHRRRGRGDARPSTSTRSRSTAASGPRPICRSGYLVVMQHPVTTEYEEARRRSRRRSTPCALRAAGAVVLAQRGRRSDGTSKGIRVFREREQPENFHLFRTCSRRTSCGCWSTATAIVGNSSVAIRECSFLGVPAVNIGSRQQGRERGRNVIDVDHDRGAIAGAIRSTMTRGRAPSDHLYGDGQRRRRGSPSCWPRRPSRSRSA